MTTANKSTLKCPVCHKKGKIQHTGKKGMIYISCDQHKVDAIKLAFHKKRTRTIWRRILDKIIGL